MLNFKMLDGDFQGDMVPPPLESGKSLGDGKLPSAILKSGKSLYSPGGGFRLMFQQDLNLVVQCLSNPPSRIWKECVQFDPPVLSAWTPLWATGSNSDATQVDMQSDGNLVVYSGIVAVWNSGTEGNPGAFLRMQDDGNLVIYSSNLSKLWATGTNAQSQL
jgi:hypothetical protein